MNSPILKSTIIAALILLGGVWTVHAANDIISFTWKGKANDTKTISVLATVGKNFTVDWGKGVPETKTGAASSIFLTSPAYGNTDDYTVTITATDANCRFMSLNVSGSSSNNNEISSLDISLVPALSYLYCSYNQLQVLDVKANTALIRLYCDNNQLSTLDVSKNTELTLLYCDNNQLSTLDVSANTELTNLWCYGNRLSLSDLYAASQKISIVNNKLLGTQTWETQNAVAGAGIDISSAYKLGTPETLTVLTVKKGTNTVVPGRDFNLAGGKLNFLSAGSYTVEMTNAAITSHSSYPAKVLASYEVVNNAISFTWKGKANGTKTISLRATAGKNFTVDWGNDDEPETMTGEGGLIILTSPDYGNTNDYTVSITTEDANCHFTMLDVSGIEISSLDLSRAPALTSLNCSDNQLKTLDLSKNTTLVTLRCYNNQLQTLNVSANTTLSTFSCSENKLTSLDVSKNTKLDLFHCKNNQMQTLDVSKNTKLTYFDCNNNQLKTLDVNKNTALTTLLCNNNQLTALDVSKNTKLTLFSCNNNQLTALDVSKNTKLAHLYCSNNQLSTLDVSANTELTNLFCYGNRLSLSDLYAASRKISDLNNKLLGTQTWETQNGVTGAEIDLSAHSILDGTLTVFTVKIGTNTAVSGTDYSLAEGRIVFLRAGSYTVEMTNAAISSYAAHPAKVLASYEVVNNAISFTWKGKANGTKTISVCATTGKSFTVDWGNGVTETKTGAGEYSNISLTSPDYGNTDDYTVTIATATDCRFTYLNVNGSSSANNEISSLDLSRAPALSSLFCYNNQLSTLDVSKNTALSSLSCSNNPLQTLDVSKNTALTYLYCQNNQLQTLDVSKNTALTNLNCYNNQLSTLDVSKNTALTNLNCYNNQLQTLDVSKNTALTNLNCYNNQLQTLDVSKNTALTYLDCDKNQLQTLDVSANTGLIRLYCYNNQLQTLDVSANTALTTLNCQSNQLKTLDVSKSTALTTLYCDNNQLSTLDVSGAPSLTILQCQNNQLQTLDVSKNTALIGLQCYNNQLSTLDVSANTELTNLFCYGNRLSLSDLYAASRKISDLNNKLLGTQTWETQNGVTGAEIDLSAHSILDGTLTVFTVKIGTNTAVSGTDYSLAEGRIVFLRAGSYTVEMTNATITSHSGYPAKVVASYEVVNDIISFTWKGKEDGTKSFRIYATPDAPFTVDWGNDDEPETMTGEGGLIILTSPDYGDTSDYTVSITTEGADCRLTMLDVSDIEISSLDLSRAPSLTVLSCRYNQLQTLDVSKNMLLTDLECSNNQLQTLDFSANTKLTDLRCSNNQLQTLDVSKNTALVTLRCYNNQLQTLDVSTNTLLTTLDCSNSPLKTLDLSKNTVLATLDCSNNQLQTLDLSKNTKLTSLMCYGNRLSLHELYAASQKISNVNNKRLGTQNWETQNAVTGAEIDLSAYSILGATPTVFTVKKGDAPALEGTDYSFAEDKLVFLSADSYTVEMTNAAIISHSFFPAKVVASYEVSPTTSIDEAGVAELRLYPNPAVDVVYISVGSGNAGVSQLPLVKIYDLNGALLFSGKTDRVNMSGYAVGVYLFDVDGEKVKVIKR
jgi:Leucine-rich repeat (LRR) protein